MEAYDENFYSTCAGESLGSARVVLPFVRQLLQPGSVVDVGCGIGTWLSVMRELGVTDVLGIDGDYVSPAMLRIPDDCFLPFDLTQPLQLERKFELAMSLEVAEHLPPECAETFVTSLTELAPVVLFSAAVPNQGGTNHVNEQWPDYWARLFRKRGFIAVDCLRLRFWDDEQVAYYYAQNSFLYVRADSLADCPQLAREIQYADTSPPALVHPRLLQARVYDLEEVRKWSRYYETYPDPHKLSLSQALGVLPELASNAVRRRMRNLSHRFDSVSVSPGIETREVS